MCFLLIYFAGTIRSQETHDVSASQEVLFTVSYLNAAVANYVSPSFTSLLSYPFHNYTTTDLMKPFSFEITPILCLEVARENSTAAAKRASKLVMYNQKIRVCFQELFLGYC